MLWNIEVCLTADRRLTGLFGGREGSQNLIRFLRPSYWTEEAAASVTAVVVAALAMAVISARSMAAGATPCIGEIQSNEREGGNCQQETHALHKNDIPIRSPRRPPSSKALLTQAFPPAENPR